MMQESSFLFKKEHFFCLEKIKQNQHLLIIQNVITREKKTNTVNVNIMNFFLIIFRFK